MLITNILFYILSFGLLLSALLVISLRNPVHSILFLILAFFNSAGLFLMLGAEFISMLMVIVYVGAVAVLFLFVVMMLDIDLEEIKSGFIKHWPLGMGISIVMLAELIMVLQVSTQINLRRVGPTLSTPEGVSNTKAIGEVLYTNYIFPFQISGLILLVAMIGAIVLSLRIRPDLRRQSIEKQVARTRNEGVELVKVQSRKGV